ncbi:MAG: hypothetical protein KKB25_02215, partial [Nanoarchaeota archaeon]|nr:hypothetical protein [Nanoarchaeota archaeon]
MKKPKNQKYELIDGNTAAAWGARLSRAQVVPNFPITPQTEIIETLAQWKANGIWNGEFVPMECYDEKTEILTEDGWKRFKDLTKNDLIATLNPNTEKLEYRKPNRIIK